LRGGAFFTGLLLLILGTGMFLISYNAANEFQSTAGQFARGLDWLFGGYFGYESDYRLYISVEVIGGIIAVLGLATMIYGAASSPSERMERLSKELSHSVTFDYWFPACPLCHKIKSVRLEVNSLGGADYAYCSNCGARWHVYIGPLDHKLKWAKLVEMDRQGAGYDLIGIQRDSAFWRGKSLEGLDKKKMVFCRYCGHKIPADSKYCIKCGKAQ